MWIVQGLFKGPSHLIRLPEKYDISHCWFQCTCFHHMACLLEEIWTFNKKERERDDNHCWKRQKFIQAQVLYSLNHLNMGTVLNIIHKRNYLSSVMFCLRTWLVGLIGSHECNMTWEQNRCFFMNSTTGSLTIHFIKRQMNPHLCMLTRYLFILFHLHLTISPMF